MSSKALIRQRLYWKLLCGFLAAVFLTAPVAAQQSGETKRVLTLFNNDSYTATQVSIDRAMRETLKSGSPFPVEMFSEFVGSTRSGTGYEKEFVALMHQKYAGKKFDVIFAVGRFPLSVLLKNRSELFPNSPIVSIAIDKRLTADLLPSPGVTALWGEIGFKSTLDLALALQPATERVVTIHGVSETDTEWAKRVQEDFREYESRLEFVPLTGLTILELRSALAAQPPNTVVIFVSSVRDRTGNTYESPEYLRQVESASAAPIYGSTDGQLGTGIVGGTLLRFDVLGAEGGQVGLRILAGEAPDTIAPKGVPSLPMFDWRQLQRWQISESSLPAGSIVRFKPPTIWEEYKWYVIGSSSLVLFESLLIGWLLILRTRKRTAELERQEFQKLAETEHRKLDQIVRNVPGVVWETRLGDGPDDRKCLFISDYVTEVFGYTPEEYMAEEPGLITKLVVEEQRQWFSDQMRDLILNGDDRVLPFKIRTKDGVEKWVEGHIAVIRDESGNPLGVRGVTMDITDRKIAEERLAAKQRQLTEAQRLAQVGSWEWYSGTGEVTWSDEIYRIYGLDPSGPAATLEEHQHLLVPESWERLSLEVANTLKTGDPYEIEIEFVRVDGCRGWGSARGELVTVNGNAGLRGTLQDITARKQGEDLIRESETRFRTLADSAPVLIWMTNVLGDWTFFNKRTLQFTGITNRDLQGRRWLQLIHADDRERVFSVYARSNARFEDYKMEYRILGGDGQYHWLHDTGVPHFSPKGEFIGLIGTCTDISEMKMAEAAIRESESRFRNIADSAPVMIWMSDPDGRNAFMNKFGLDYTGLSEDGVKGSGWLSALHKDDTKQLVETYRDGHERRVPVVTEFRLRGADGTFRWFFSTSAPRIDANGTFLGFIGTCVDIDDRKQAEGALQLALTEINQLKNKLQEENIYLKEEIKLIHDFDEIVGESEALKYVLFKIEQVAPTNATVMITGETGTGKELVARAVHSASYLKHKPLVKVNCAALAANFIESELFGHEKGSFTGATGKRIGRFELAQGGTIFLDEIGELPLDLQVKLLRVLQEGEFERLGSSKTIKVDVRVIAATNRDLRSEVEKGNFREDLLFRLNVFPITVPPLRERKDDIPLLVNYYVQRFGKRLGKNITSVAPGVMRTLMDHSWPGNIRELANVIERSVISTKGETLRNVEGMDLASISNGSGTSVATLEQVERDYISEILRSTDWKIEGKSGAAQILGLNPSTLRTRMQKLGILRIGKKNNGS